MLKYLVALIYLFAINAFYDLLTQVLGSACFKHELLEGPDCTVVDRKIITLPLVCLAYDHFAE